MHLSADAAALRVFERKALRKIFDPMRVDEDFSILSNNELLSDIDIVHRIKPDRPCRSKGGKCSSEAGV